MSEETIELNADQIDQLATKLDSLEEVLDDRDKTVLLAVFQLASQSLAGAADDSEVEGFAIYMNSNPQLKVGKVGHPRLSDGFRSSFSPGVGNPISSGDGGVTGGVTVKVSW